MSSFPFSIWTAVGQLCRRKREILLMFVYHSHGEGVCVQYCLSCTACSLADFSLYKTKQSNFQTKNTENTGVSFCRHISQLNWSMHVSCSYQNPEGNEVMFVLDDPVYHQSSVMTLKPEKKEKKFRPSSPIMWLFTVWLISLWAKVSTRVVV